MSTLSRSPLSSSSSTSSSVSPLKRKAMSVTQTYYLAHTARGKLSSEAGRGDHNLRLLVGHANLLDSLMLDLAAAEREQESWFNQSVKKAAAGSKASKPEEPKPIQWVDTVVEDPEEDWQVEDVDDSSDSDSEYYSDEEDVEMPTTGVASLQRVVASHPVVATETVVDDEEYDEDAEGEFGFELQLTRSHSENKLAPPELDHDSDDSSEDESMPPSPPSTALPSFSEKQHQEIATTAYYSKSHNHQSSIPPSDQQAFFDEGFYLPQRTQPGLISTISVY